MGKVLCIGEALIDMICTDKGLPLTEGEHFLKKPGGAPTNVAAAIAALGGEVELAAKIGVDPFGQHLLSVMHSFGVGTRWMIQDPDHFTTFAFVSLMENGERDFYFNRGADGELGMQDLNGLDLSEFSIAHFGSATGFLPGPLQAVYKKVLHQSCRQGLLVSFDPNYRELLFGPHKPAFVSRSWPFLEQCDFFKVSDEEALLLTASATLTDAVNVFLERTRAVFAITLGKEGTLLGFNGQSHLVPSIPVQPVDTTGAGDAFVGAVLYQLSGLSKTVMKALPLEQWIKIVMNANKAGARTCEYMGAMEAFRFLNNDVFK